MNRAGLLASILSAAATWGCLDPTASDPSSELRIAQIERTSTGAPYFVSGSLGQVTGDVRSPDALAAALPAIAGTLGVPASDLKVREIATDQLGMTHVRMSQTKNGLRVVSGEAILHLDSEGTVRSVDSGLLDRNLSASPIVGADAATQLAVSSTSGEVSALGSELVYVIANSDGEMYLAWEIPVRGVAESLVHDLVYVDAIDGRVIERHPRIFTAKSRRILNGNNGTYPVANAPVIGTEGAPPGAADATGLAAYNNTGLTYDCFKELFNRDSYNNTGALLTSQVRVRYNLGNGQTSPNNAAWDDTTQMMSYGDGDGVQMGPLALAFDVTAHELTHAVTSLTANMVYLNESGALNEGISDIMSAVCQAWKDKTVNANTWFLGEQIWTPNIAGDALRYMDNPTKDQQSPDFYPERYVGTADGGGVHLNSGMPNLAFYLLTAGGNHPRAKTAVKVPGIGIERAGAIFYRALTTKWGPNTNLAAARTGVEQAAAELYPASCASTAASLAFAAVGIGAAVPPDTTPPTVAITSPATGAKVSKGFEVAVNTTDDKCINKVELLIDGVVAKTLTAPPYTFTTDASLSSGSHTIEVKSYDAFASSSSTATVTVSGNGTGGGNGNGNGNGNGDGDGDGNPDGVTGGCSTGGSGTGLLLGLAIGLVGLFRRRR